MLVHRRVTPSIIGHRYPFIHLGRERYCESEVSGLRTQHNVWGQESNSDCHPESSTLTMRSPHLNKKANKVKNNCYTHMWGTYLIIISIFVVIMIIMNPAVYFVVEQLGSWIQHKQSRHNKYETLNLSSHTWNAWLIIIIIIAVVIIIMINTNPLALDSSQGTNLSLHSCWSCSWC